MVDPKKGTIMTLNWATITLKDARNVFKETMRHENIPVKTMIKLGITTIQLYLAISKRDKLSSRIDDLSTTATEMFLGVHDTHKCKP